MSCACDMIRNIGSLKQARDSDGAVSLPIKRNDPKKNQIIPLIKLRYKEGLGGA